MKTSIHHLSIWRKLAMASIVVCSIFFIDYANADITILDVAWTNGINGKNQPIKRYSNKGKAPQGPLYLWMKVKGDVQVQHRWFRYLGTRPYLDKTQTPKRVKQGANWYIWTGKQNIQPGWWRVNVINANSKRPVKCGRKHCVYSIHVEK
ncbi:hypothetical protein QUF54_06525 [Candidatus Marithioploca araucensis]|uniref:DUF2914 domain-containing protein n=1 Tax=Candidatus Marithioploca araucensis TaxID=70273 RepID=A0ABT7VTT7_9GAMM|nr:hypothetical protein [Candidatus Marithioploca araucensis]